MNDLLDQLKTEALELYGAAKAAVPSSLMGRLAVVAMTSSVGVCCLSSTPNELEGMSKEELDGALLPIQCTVQSDQPEVFDEEKLDRLLAEKRRSVHLFFGSKEVGKPTGGMDLQIQNRIRKEVTSFIEHQGLGGTGMVLALMRCDPADLCQWQAGEALQAATNKLRGYESIGAHKVASTRRGFVNLKYNLWGKTNRAAYERWLKRLDLHGGQPRRLYKKEYADVFRTGDDYNRHVALFFLDSCEVSKRVLAAKLDDPRSGTTRAPGRGSRRTPSGGAPRGDTDTRVERRSVGGPKLAGQTDAHPVSRELEPTRVGDATPPISPTADPSNLRKDPPPEQRSLPAPGTGEVQPVPPHRLTTLAVVDDRQLAAVRVHQWPEYPDRQHRRLSRRQTLDDILSSDALRGRPVLVVFSAIWCEPCFEEAKLLGQAQAGSEAGLKVLTIMYDTADKVPGSHARKMMQEGWAKFAKFGVKRQDERPVVVFTVNQDAEAVLDVRRAFGIPTEDVGIFPELTLLTGDPERRVVYHHVGSIEKDWSTRKKFMYAIESL